MHQTNRPWMPHYCHPERFMPPIQQTDALFQQKPYYFPDFVARALAYLQGEEARKMGFVYNYDTVLPCKWKCADESLFQVDLTLVSYSGHFPFDKGTIGGHFNRGSLGAAVHHGAENVDFGGSHVGYVPGSGGGSFGYIWRPQHQSYSTDCGYLMRLLGPFVEVYNSAQEQITVHCPPGEDLPLVSIPNEFLQPSWSSDRIKLLVDLETLTAGPVPPSLDQPQLHIRIARSLFRLHPEVLERMPEDAARALCSPEPTPLGQWLEPRYFVIFDTSAKLDAEGVPCQRILAYMNQIVAARRAPCPLKAAVVNTDLEYNQLTDSTRGPDFVDHGFASFTGIFIDMYDESTGNYANLFQPVALTIKGRGHNGQVDLTGDELRERLDVQKPAAPRLPLGEAITPDSGQRLLNQFTFSPGHFQTIDR